jgi:hypothetical protein
MYKSILLFILITLVSCKPSGEEKSANTEEKIIEESSFIIESSLENSNGMNGDINIMGYFVDPSIKGTLQQNGSFRIELPGNFDQVTEKAFETYNSSPVADYNLKYSTALESFPNADALSFTGKDAQLAFAGKYYRFEVSSDNESAFIYPASSENFVKYVVGTKDAIPETGFNYYYIYAKDPFSINGDTKSDYLFEDGTEEIYSRTDSYSLDVTLGWNLIRYEIKELAESSLGTQNISETAVFNVDMNTKPESWFISSK